MKVGIETKTFDSEVRRLLGEYKKNEGYLVTYAVKNGIKKRELVSFVLETGKYLNDTPDIDEEAITAINKLVEKGIIPVAVAESIMSRIDRIKNEGKKRNTTYRNY